MMDVELDIKKLLEISQEDDRMTTTEGGHRYHDVIQSRLDNLQPKKNQPKVIGTLRLFDAVTLTSSTNSTTLEQEEGHDDNRNNNVDSFNSDNHSLLTEEMIVNLSLWLEETFGAETGVVIQSLVIYCHSFTFESSKARKRFISSIIQNLNIKGGQFWIKVGKTITWTDAYDGGGVESEFIRTTSQRNNDMMIVEMLDLLSSLKPSPLFNPKEIYICDLGPQVIPSIRDFYNHYNGRLDILSIHLGYQYLAPRCHQRFEWTLQNLSDLVNIFNRNDNNNKIARVLSHNTNPQIHLRIHHDSLTKKTTTNNKDIVSQILHVLLEGKSSSSSSQVVDSSSSISSLALVGFPTPPNNPGKLLTTFLERNHSVETLFPIWKPSGMTTQEKHQITQLGKLNKDLKRYLKEARLYLQLQQQQQVAGNDYDDEIQEQQHRQNDLVAPPPKLWSIFLAKVASISPSKLYYLLLEGGDFLFFQNR